MTKEICLLFIIITIQIIQSIYFIYSINKLKKVLKKKKKEQSLNNFSNDNNFESMLGKIFDKRSTEYLPHEARYMLNKNNKKGEE